MITILLDLIPVLLAIYALYLLSGIDSIHEVYFAKITAILLIICQTTWIHSYMFDIQSIKSVIDVFWTIFNTSAMVLAILVALNHRK
jgi:hypothetical protein